MPKLKLFIFSLLPVLFFLFLLEGLAWVFLPKTSQEPEEQTKQMYDPKKLQEVKEGLQIPQINRYAFRGREFNFEKKEDEFVLIILGGSVASGAWANRFENVPSVYIETHLADFVQKKYNKKLIAYSLAESGADIEDEAFWLLKLGLGLKPDAVVSITGFNNMFNSLRKDWEFSSGSRGFMRTGIVYQPTDNEGVMISSKKLLNAIYIYLSKKTSFFKLVDHWKKQTENPDKTLSKEERHFAFLKQFEKPSTMPLLPAKRFRQTAEAIQGICEEKKIQYLVVLQPFKDCGKQQMEQLPTNGQKDNREQYIYRTMRMVWQDVRIPSFDASYALGDTLANMNAFGDNCHLWDNGFVLFNQSMVDFLKKELD